LIEACSQVKDGEPLRLREFVQKLIHNWDMELTLNNEGIEHPVIHTKSPRMILFANQEDRRGEGASARLNEARLEHF
jgi:hypothetical protein